MGESQESGAVATVQWSGEIFADSASKCRDGLLKAFSEADTVLLDMSGCSEVDVSAIQLIVAASLEASRTGKTFSITGSVSPQVKKAFTVAGVDLDIVSGG